MTYTTAGACSNYLRNKHPNILEPITTTPGILLPVPMDSDSELHTGTNINDLFQEFLTDNILQLIAPDKALDKSDEESPPESILPSLIQESLSEIHKYPETGQAGYPIRSQLAINIRKMDNNPLHPFSNT